MKWWWTDEQWTDDALINGWRTDELLNWRTDGYQLPDGTHVNLGSDLRVWMWVSETPFWDLTDVTLADEDTNWLCQ